MAQGLDLARTERPALVILGSTHQLFTRLLPKWGIAHSYVDGDDPDDVLSDLTAALAG